MAPNPQGETRSVWPLLALALVSGLITMALSAPNSDATREAGAEGDMSPAALQLAHPDAPADQRHHR